MKSFTRTALVSALVALWVGAGLVTFLPGVPAILTAGTGLFLAGAALAAVGILGTFALGVGALFSTEG